MFDGSVLKDETIKSNCADFITSVLNGNKIPSYLKNFRLTLISKSNQSETKIEDTRPISIGSHLLKIIEKAIKLKLESLRSELL